MNVPRRKEAFILFGARLRGIRESLNLSQEQIHYATAITQQHIAKIEAGEINIGLNHIAILADFFGLEHFEMLQYKAAIPDAEQLRKNVLSYLKQHDINADIFIKKSLTYLILSKVINSRFLSSPKSTREIQTLLMDKFEAKFTSARVSDALDRLAKKGLIEKVRTENTSKVLYRKV